MSDREDAPTATIPNSQVHFKSDNGRLLLQLPGTEATASPLTWEELWQQLKHRLSAGDRHWQPQAAVHLLADDRLLDVRQLDAIATALSEAELQLQRVYTQRRQTAVAAATCGYSVEQQPPQPVLEAETAAPEFADPLYLETTIRSGTEVRHPGTIVVVGDINPGGSAIAHGDILVWGRLRGLAHAGANGNSRCVIMALQMEPTQLRIADAVARAPAAPDRFHPEVAYTTASGIRIRRANEFVKKGDKLKSN